MDTRNIINANGAVITRAIVLATLAKSNLHWEMHHAQVYALECQVVFTWAAFGSRTERHPKRRIRELLSRPQTNVTLMGLPVIIDNERYPKGLVRLMSGDTELSRIECLAVPGVFCEGYTEEEAERERQEVRNANVRIGVSWK